MIPVPAGVRVWLATGVTDMRRGMNGLTLQVQEAMGRDPYEGSIGATRFAAGAPLERDERKKGTGPSKKRVTPRGWAGPSLLAMIPFEKYGQHQPLNRQSERYGREGVALSLSTLADQVGACAVVLRPLYVLIAAHVLAAERLHDDDTTVPVLAKGKAEVARAWVYVCDDAPFGSADPPAA